MKKLVIGVAISAGAIMASQAAYAQEGLVRARVVLASNSYSLAFDNADPNTDYRGRTAKASYRSTGIGLTLVSGGGMYLDFVATTSADATHDLWATSRPFKRDEQTLTLGYGSSVGTGTLSGFLGYKAGTTELNSLGFLPVAPAYRFTKDTFETGGFFFGAGYGFPAAGGQIGLNAALAFMSGDWTDDHSPIPYDVSADLTLGFSFGLSYTYMFGRNFGASVDLKANTYSYNFGQATSTPYTNVETITSIGLNLIGQF